MDIDNSNYKVKQKYIDETLEQTWKTIHSELPTEVTWDDDMGCFCCSNSRGSYFSNYKDFFHEHVIQENTCSWGDRERLTEQDIEDRKMANWVCLFNGHNVFEDYRDRYPHVEVKHNEGCNLLDYIKERSGDVVYSMRNNTALDWLQPYIADDLEKMELESK